MGKNSGCHNVVSRYRLPNNAKGVSVVYRKALCIILKKKCKNLTFFPVTLCLSSYKKGTSINDVRF